MRATRPGRSGFLLWDHIEGTRNDGSAGTIAGARAGAVAGGGEHAAAAGGAARWCRAVLAQGGVVESRRQREGPRGAEHPARRHPPGARARPAAPRRVERQYRHRLRDARCGRGRRRDDLPAGQRQPGAAGPARGLRGRGRGHRPDGGNRGRRAEGARAGGGRSRTATSTPISTAIRPTRRPTGRPRAPSSGRRPAAGSPTSWPPWGRREP